MALGLTVAQFQRMRPSLDGVIVSSQHFLVGLFNRIHQGGILNGNGCLIGQRLEEIQPFRVRGQGTAVKNFEHAQNPALCDQRRAVIGDKAGIGKFLAAEQRIRGLFGMQHIDRFHVQRGPTGMIFAQFDIHVAHAGFRHSHVCAVYQLLARI